MHSWTKQSPSKRVFSGSPPFERRPEVKSALYEADERGISALGKGAEVMLSEVRRVGDGWGRVGSWELGVGKFFFFFFFFLNI